jgi:hypothetical protein
MASQARDFRVQMSFDALLERKINAGWRVVWVVNYFKGLEVKYRALITAINLDTADIAQVVSCDSLHIKRTGLSSVKPASVTQKCDSDVPLPYVWGSAGVRFS